MKISSDYRTINTKFYSSPDFRGINLYKSNNTDDKFRLKMQLISNYECDSKTNRLKRVVFRHPVHVCDALDCIIGTNDIVLQNKFLNLLHTMDSLYLQSEDLRHIPELNDYKVKSIHGLGNFALAFETESGMILKITNFPHFPHERKPDFFDLPLIKSGKYNYTHYYLEEKTSQDNISQKELRNFVKQIEKEGYILRDLFVNPDCPDGLIKTEQFGKTAAGKLYLIDPGCAIAPSKNFFKIKHTIKNIIKFLLH